MRTALYLVSISLILLLFFVNEVSILSSVRAGNQHDMVVMPKIGRNLSSYGVSCELGLFNKLVHIDVFVYNGSWVKILSSGPSLLENAEREELVLWDKGLKKVVLWIGTPTREPIFWDTGERSCGARRVNDTLLVDLEGGSMLYIRFNGPILLQTNELNISYNINEVIASGSGWSSVIPVDGADEMQLIFGNNITIYLNKNVAAVVGVHVSRINWIRITGSYSEIGALRGAFPWTSS